MNVLFLTCWYPTPENPGFGIFVKEHAKAVDAQPGIHLKVLQIWPVKCNSFFEKEITVFTDENGIETHQILIKSFAYKLVYLANNLLNALALKYVRKAFNTDWKPDIIHGNVVFQAGVITAFLSEKLKVPYVISEHWSGLDWYIKTPYVQSKAGVNAYKNAKCIFPVSQHLMETIKSKIYGKLVVQVVPNVVATNLFKFSEHQIARKRLNLLCVTNFKMGKTVFKLPGLILDALELMTSAERDNFQIDFIGGGDGLTDFKNRINALEYSDFVNCLGFRPKAEVASMMHSSDALIHPSVAETFGVVVAEGLCSGLPCVVSDVPALDELVDETNGILVSENSPEKWMEALILLHVKCSSYDKSAIASKAEKLYNPDRIGRLIVENYSE